MACQSIGLPASSRYCFGSAPALREPLPAAGINAKMDKEVLLIQDYIITRFFC